MPPRRHSDGRQQKQRGKRRPDKRGLILRQGIANERRGVQHVDEGVVGQELGRHALEHEHVIGRPGQQERSDPA